MTNTYEFLKRNTEFVIKGTSITFAYEVYGEVKMARFLEAISEDEFNELKDALFNSFICRADKW